MKKIKSKIIFGLILIFLNTSKIYSMDEDLNQRLPASFPGIDIIALKRQIQIDQSRVEVLFSGEHGAGYNLNDITLFHHKIFQVSGKKKYNILEVGAGNGTTTARLLLTNAAHIDAVELIPFSKKFS